jgi:hypothetical protein
VLLTTQMVEERHVSTDSSISTYSRTDGNLTKDDDLARPARFGGVSESTAVRGIIDVAMVGLIGGGPRLAIRAARVFLEDSYTSRISARDGRLRRRARIRG